jgi:hypothetical protein
LIATFPLAESAPPLSTTVPAGHVAFPNALPPDGRGMSGMVTVRAGKSTAGRGVDGPVAAAAAVVGASTRAVQASPAYSKILLLMDMTVSFRYQWLLW